MTQPPIVPGAPPPDPNQPPPQVVYVYAQPPQPQSQQVTKGIWDFVFQWWIVLGSIVLFFVVCCAGVAILGSLSGH